MNWKKAVIATSDWEDCDALKTWKEACKECLKQLHRRCFSHSWGRIAAFCLNKSSPCEQPRFCTDREFFVSLHLEIYATEYKIVSGSPEVTWLLPLLREQMHCSDYCADNCSLDQLQVIIHLHWCIHVWDCATQRAEHVPRWSPKLQGIRKATILQKTPWKIELHDTRDIFLLTSFVQQLSLNAMVMMYVAMAVNTLLAMTAHSADWAERMGRVTHLAQLLGVPESCGCPVQNRTVQGQKVDQLKYRQDDHHSLYCFLQPPNASTHTRISRSCASNAYWIGDRWGWPWNYVWRFHKVTVVSVCY